MKCVGFERLIDYLDGRLTDEEARPVAEHLAHGCARCESDRRWYALLMSMKDMPEPVEPPAWVFRRALRLFENRRETQSAGKRAARAVARLVFDSFSQPALAGARSGAAATSRHLLYAVDDYSIDLRVAPAGETGVDFVGQVLSASESGFDAVAGIAVDIAREGKTVMSVAADETGVFSVRQIDPGEYDLQIDARDLIIDIVGLRISPIDEA